QLRSGFVRTEAQEHRGGGGVLSGECGRRGKCKAAGDLAAGRRLFQLAATGYGTGDSDSHGGGAAKRTGAGQFAPSGRSGLGLGRGARRDTAQPDAHAIDPAAATEKTV